MRNNSLKTVVGALATAMTLTFAAPVLATPYAEVGDAGFTLATAQMLPGGTTSVSGGLGTGDAVDVYRFSWGGGTIVIDTQGGANFDSMLYVFDLGGNLLAFNDDFPFCCQSQTPPVNLVAGDYLMAIDNFPYNFGGNLAGFANAANLSGAGQYTIHINNATTGVPEPASLALLGLGLLGLGVARKRKSV